MAQLAVLLLLVAVSACPSHGKTLFWKPAVVDALHNLIMRHKAPTPAATAPDYDRELPKSYGPFPQSADTCAKDKCKLPSCRCSGTDIPGGLNVTSTPLIVILSFQTAVNNQNFDKYTALFSGRKNPNGCPRAGTFFVSHNHR